MKIYWNASIVTGCICIPDLTTRCIFNPRGDYKFIVEKELLPKPAGSDEFEVKHRNGTAKMLKDGYFFNGDWIYAVDIENEEVMNKLAKEAERIYKEKDYFTIVQ